MDPCLLMQLVMSLRQKKNLNVYMFYLYLSLTNYVTINKNEKLILCKYQYL